jgi:hypothetical protein
MCTYRVAKTASALVFCFTVVFAVGGCALGPKALEQSHGRYNESIRRVYEEQLLRNLVHLRYNEVPLALDVSSIATQYELSAQAEARPFFSTESVNSIFRAFSRVLPDVQVSGSSRPTISLTPTDDSDAIRQFITPIPGETLILLVQTGTPVSTVLRLWAERLNGVPNGVPAGTPQYPAALDFVRFQHIAELLQVAQDRELISLSAEERIQDRSGPLPPEAVTAAAAVEAAKNGLEYRPRPDGKTWALVRKQRVLKLKVNPTAQGNPELMELSQLLNLQPGLRQYELTFITGGIPDPIRQPGPPSAILQLVPRANAQVYAFLANGVEVPAEHLASGIAQPLTDLHGQPLDGREITRGLFEVHACKGHRPPPTAFVAIPYRGYWYYIDDRDQSSKVAFAMVGQLSRLDFGRLRSASRPLLTLPVGR